MPFLPIVEHIPQVIIPTPLLSIAQLIKDIRLPRLPPIILALRSVFSWWGISISTSLLMPSTNIPPVGINLIVVMAVSKLWPTMVRAGHWVPVHYYAVGGP